MITIALHVLGMGVLIYAIAELLPAVEVKTFSTAVFVAVVYGVLSYVLFAPLATITTLPMIVTLGLFGLLINAFLLWLTDKLVDDFEIDGIGMTLLMAVLLTMGKWILSSVLPGS